MLRKKILPLYLVIILTTNSFCDQCGKESGSRYRISGGHETRPHQYPWMVYFEFREHVTEDIPYVCGGSLINEWLVLTAKHCVENSTNWRNAKAAVHDVKHGDFVELEFDRKLFPDNDHKYNDIAIIKLKTPVDLENPRIGRVCLPDNDRENYFGDEAKTMGWGMVKYDFQNKKGVWENELKEVDLTVTDDTSEFNLFTHVNEKKGVYQDPCPGDSGGPLLVKRGPSWEIIAVVTGSGFDCEHGELEGNMGIWTKVAPNLKWIKRMMNRYGKEKKGYYNRGFRGYNRGFRNHRQIY